MTLSADLRLVLRLSEEVYEYPHSPICLHADSFTLPYKYCTLWFTDVLTSVTQESEVHVRFEVLTDLRLHDCIPEDRTLQMKPRLHYPLFNLYLYMQMTTLYQTDHNYSRNVEPLKISIAPTVYVQNYSFVLETSIKSIS